MNGIEIGKISKGSYYFKLPSMRVMAVIYFIFQLTSSFITTGDLVIALSIAAVTFFMALVLSYSLFKVAHKVSASKPNRFFGMFLFQTFTSASCQILAFLLSPFNKFVSLFVLLLGALCSVFMLISLTEVFAGSAAPSVLIWAVSTGSTLLYASKLIDTLALACLATISFLVALCFLYYVNSSSTNEIASKPTKMFMPYLKYKLDGEGEDLESLLKATSKRSKVNLIAICFDRDRSPLLLVNLGVHFGPFNSIGSSSLPSDAFWRFRDEVGAFALFTHPFSSHEKDIASKEETKRILDISLEELKRYSSHPVVKMTPFFHSSYGIFDIWVSLCGDAALCIARSKDPTIDDLPDRALRGMLEGSENFGVNKIYDIDAHNNISFPLPNKPSDANCDDLVQGYLNALSLALASPKVSVKVGYANVPMDGRQDIGPLGISALVFDFGYLKQALIVIDGNNMVAGLAEKIVERVKEASFSDVIVITNDNHVLSGVFNVDGGYYPVGAKDGGLVVEKAFQAVEDAIHDISECEIKVVTAEVGDALFLGDGLVDLLLVTIKALRRFKISLVGYFSYSLFLSALFASLR